VSAIPLLSHCYSIAVLVVLVALFVLVGYFLLTTIVCIGTHRRHDGYAGVQMGEFRVQHRCVCDGWVGDLGVRVVDCECV